jgi:transposase
MSGDVGSFTLAHLPIVKAYAQRMGFVGIIDQALPGGMHASPGKILLGLVMNVLCSRSPLYRVEEFFRTRDVGLLLGEDMTAGMLNDDAIGRVLDRIYEYGTWKIYSEICLHAFWNFGVDCSVVHEDTTSVSVWGEYKPAPADPIRIVHGFSKDKRPDLKQFILSLLCVEGNLPCHGGVLDGNASDKKNNGKIIMELPRIMARHGIGNRGFIYVADSALATEENLSLMGDDIQFITRLPENFGVCGELIGRSVSSGSWQEVGRLSHRKVKGKEVCASYRLQEETVVFCGRTYRAVVVHSDAHDRRRQKRIDNAIKKDGECLGVAMMALRKKEFFCLPDAHAAAAAFKDGDFHRISCSFESRPVYGRGRPCKNGDRRVKEIRHRVLATMSENQVAVEKLREEAGCFVLLTNVPAEEKEGLEILKSYKEQDGIERNFGFLKDPLVANDVFLKKPRRIEAMGLVLVLSLLLWRLMERAMRRKIKEENIVLQGWNNRDTVKPTSFLMASKFSPVFVGVKGNRRFLFTPLDEVQLAYLNALDVHPAIFTQINLLPNGTGRAGYH